MFSVDEAVFGPSFAVARFDWYFILFTTTEKTKSSSDLIFLIKIHWLISSRSRLKNGTIEWHTMSYWLVVDILVTDFLVTNVRETQCVSPHYWLTQYIYWGGVELCCTQWIYRSAKIDKTFPVEGSHLQCQWYHFWHMSAFVASARRVQVIHRFHFPLM